MAAVKYDGFVYIVSAGPSGCFSIGFKKGTVKEIADQSFNNSAKKVFDDHKLYSKTGLGSAVKFVLCIDCKKVFEEFKTNYCEEYKKTPAEVEQQIIDNQKTSKDPKGKLVVVNKKVLYHDDMYTGTLTDLKNVIITAYRKIHDVNKTIKFETYDDSKIVKPKAKTTSVGGRGKGKGKVKAADFSDIGIETDEPEEEEHQEEPEEQEESEEPEEEPKEEPKRASRVPRKVNRTNIQVIEPKVLVDNTNFEFTTIKAKSIFSGTSKTEV